MTDPTPPPADNASRADTPMATWDDGPLDGTRLAADIAATVPGPNAKVRRAEWRSDLKRRVVQRLARTKEHTK